MRAAMGSTGGSGAGTTTGGAGGAGGTTGTCGLGFEPQAATARLIAASAGSHARVLMLGTPAGAVGERMCLALQAECPLEVTVPRG